MEDWQAGPGGAQGIDYLGKGLAPSYQPHTSALRETGRHRDQQGNAGNTSLSGCWED